MELNYECNVSMVDFAPYKSLMVCFVFQTESNHDTALTLACAGGHEELVSVLIARGANIEHRDKKGRGFFQTPLHTGTSIYELNEFLKRKFLMRSKIFFPMSLCLLLPVLPIFLTIIMFLHRKTICSFVC